MCTVPLMSTDGLKDLVRHSSDLLAVRNCPLFAGLTAENYSAIYTSARSKSFKRGEMLYFKGDCVRHLSLLISGSVKITQFGVNGSEVILSLRVPGDVLGATRASKAQVHYSTAQAFRLCRALIWDVKTFEQLLEHCPVLHQNMAEILGKDIAELEERFQELATEKVSSRVARQLLRLQSKIGRPTDGGIEVSLSRQELAQMTGTTLFTVSRTLSSWETIGLLRASREAVTIFDGHSLEEVADAGETASFGKMQRRHG